MFPSPSVEAKAMIFVYGIFSLFVAIIAYFCDSNSFLTLSKIS